MDDVAIVIRPALKRGCCDDDACRAALYNQLLYCIAWKVKQGADYWYGTHKEICSSLLDDCWSLSKIIKELNNLVEQGLIGQRRNPTKGYDQTRQYFFEREHVLKLKEKCDQVGVCIFHTIGFPPEVIHLLNLTNGFSKNNKCICYKNQMDLVDLPNASIKFTRAIPKKASKNTTKKEEERTDFLPSLPSEKTCIELSTEAQGIYEEWCKMPWLKIKPKITANLAGYLEKATAYHNLTADIMLKVKDHALSHDKNGYYAGKTWGFHFFLNELPGWISMQHVTPERKKTRQPTYEELRHSTVGI